MTASRRSFVVVLAAILLVALAVCLRFAAGQPVELPTDAPAPDAPARVVTAPVAVAEAAPTASPAASAGEREAAPAPAPGPLAIVRGRCVDAQGAPLAACRARVHGWMGNEARMDAWRRDHARLDWQDPPVVATAADGRFELAFWPPPPFQFTLDLEHDRFAQQSARWSTIAPGAVVDVGDVVMRPGIRVQGRTVDEAGRPVADVTLRVLSGSDRSAGSRPMLSSPWSVYASSGADGSFTLPSLLPPGPFRVEAEVEHAGSKPVDGVLVGERPVEVVTFVVVPRPKGPTITGLVVDESGAPLGGAAVHARGDRGEWFGSSAADGAFVVMRTSAESAVDELVRLAARHDLCEPSEPTAAMPWGTAGVRLTLRRAGGLAVHVVDEAGQPLTDFAVRVVAQDPAAQSSHDVRVRARGPFADGFAAVPGIGRGKWTVVVEFPTAASRAPVFTPIEVASGRTMRVDVRAPRDVRRTLRLVDGAGQPIAGSVVQLAVAPEGALSERTQAQAREAFFAVGGQGRALVLMDATTDAAGEAQLVGPPGVDLALLALGPGHVPTRRGDVRLDQPGDLVLPVAIGARLRGRAGPPEALATLRGLAQPGWPAPSLQLRQATGASLAVLPTTFGDARFRIADDGDFDLGGLPPGAWQVRLQYTAPGTVRSVFLGAVALADSVTTEFAPDLRAALPGTLRGTVTRNGAPVANTGVQLVGATTGEPGAAQAFEQAFARTDAAGRFTALVSPGVYRVLVPGARMGAALATTVACVEAVAVTAGATVDHAFTAASGALRITVRDASGAAMVGVALFARPAAGGDVTALAVTDAQGQLLAELAAEGVRLLALPQRVQAQIPQDRLVAAMRAGVGGQLGGAMLDLGAATVVAGQTVAVALTLPAAWADGAAAK